VGAQTSDGRTELTSSSGRPDAQRGVSRTLSRWASPALRRLGANLATRRAELEARWTRREPAAPSTTAQGLLNNADEALKGGDVDAGWRFLHAAERAEVLNYTPDELEVFVVAVRNEASRKLTGWRGAAAAELLGPTGASTPSAANVQEAMRLLHEHSDNVYHKIQLLRGQLRVLGLILALSLVAFELVMAFMGATIGVLDWREGLKVMIAGALGGALSGVRSLGERSDRKIPEWLYDWPITALRPLLGAAAATGLALIIQSGVVKFADGNVVALLAAAFLAGFSERWFLSLIRTAGGEAEPKAEKK